MTIEYGVLRCILKRRWNLEDVPLVRRIGTLDIGEIISLTEVSSPSSNDAFDACRHGLARLKKIATLRKTERFLAKERE